MSSFTALGARLQQGGIVSDPWLDGAPRFREAPVVLDAGRGQAIAEAACGIARVHDELARLVAAEPELVDSYFGLTPWQRGMWQCAGPDWHGIARADVFWTADGAKVCELNSDTPSGEPEAVWLNALANHREPHWHDPNAGLPHRFVAMVEAWARTCGHRVALTVGLLYPTEITEDLAMVAAYRQWLEAAGHLVVLGAPCNLGQCADGRATLFGEPCDVIVRHYKTDWFGERLPVADDDERCADVDPLVQPLLALLAAGVHRRTAIVNPFGAVLTQNKRAMAFCWEHRDRFSAASQAAIARWLPRTFRLEAVREELWQQKDRFVLKSDYGCEGMEVVVGRAVDQATWHATLTHAIARRWIAQEHFAALPDADGDVVNHGVYVVGGQAAGVFARVHGADVATGATARCAPVFVVPAEAAR